MSQNERPSEARTELDLFEWQLAEQALRESRELLQRTINNAPLVVFSLDIDGRFVLSEGRGLVELGLKPGQVVGQSIFDLYHDNPEILESFRRALSGEELAVLISIPERNLTYECAWMPRRNTQGDIVGVSGVATDISKSIQAESARHESETRLRVALSAARMGVWDWDAAANRTKWDIGMHEIMGISEVQFASLSDPAQLLIHPEDRERFRNAVEHSSRTGELYQLEFRIIRPDGKVRWISDQGRAELDANGKIRGFLGVARDITEQREIQEQLQRAQKMEAIGQLAGGIAHDFNNLLMVIRGNTELLLEHAPDSPELRRGVDTILGAADRAARITRQLLAFSRKQVLQPRVVEIGSVVSETANLLRRLLGPTILLEVRLPGERLRVCADLSQLEQVVLNLVLNARDAMPDGGTVTVSVDRIPAGSAALWLHREMRDMNYVRLAVQDTGIGMDAATQARIFEPFFTTKEPGKGTGLGLATVYGIIKQSEGWIWVDSAVGRGTRFDVFLPETTEAELAGQRGAARRVAPDGTGTLLVVDDEEDIRELAVEFLASMGYHVLSASTGPDALEVSRQHCGAIDVLITDVLMPGMSGAQLAEKLRQKRPAMKVLYISGYAAETGIPVSLPDTGELLQKPFALVELLAKLRQLMHA